MWWPDGQKIMAYLFKYSAYFGWVGYEDGTFRPNEMATAQMFYKVMLVALGYKQDVDFAYADVIGYVKALGMGKAANVEVFTNADIATVLVEALKTKVKGTDTTLAQKLVTDGVITKANALATGLIAPDPAVKVVSADGTNIKEIVVKFNYEMDAATITVSNFLIGGANSAAVALSTDKKSVTVTVPGAPTLNPAYYALTVKAAVKNTAGAALPADYVATVAVADVTAPQALSVALTAPTKFEITFSEPMQAATVGTVLVNNGFYAASIVTPLAGTNKVSVNLAAALPEGSYTIKVLGFKDYAGLAIATTDLTLAYVKDVTPLTVAITGTPQQNSVMVKFSKPVVTTLTPAYFYHTFPVWQPTSVATTDQQTFTLNFSTFPIPAGTYNVTVLKTVGSVSIADAWGNTLAANVDLPVTVSADLTPPTWVLTSSSATSIRVTYSEAVTGATTVGNYVIKNSAGAAVTVATATLVSGNIYDIGFAALPATGDTYSVTVQNVKDASLYQNPIVAATATFVIADTLPPSVTSSTYVTTGDPGTVTYIYLTFDGAMAQSGAGSVLDVNNFRLNNAVLPSAAAIAAMSTSKIKITVPATTSLGAAKLEFGQLADANGNKIVALQTEVTLVAEGAPAVTAVKTVNLYTLEITVNKILVAVPADSFQVTVGGVSNLPAYVSFAVSGTTTKITATLQSVSWLPGPGAKPDNIIIAANKMLADVGTYVPAGTFTTPITDGIAPSVASAGYTAPTIFTLTFNEAMQSLNDTLAATDFTVTYDGTVLVAGVGYTFTSGAPGFTTATITVPGAVSGKVLKIETKATVAYLTDVSLNKLNSGFTASITIP